MQQNLVFAQQLGDSDHVSSYLMHATLPQLSPGTSTSATTPASLEVQISQHSTTSFLEMPEEEVAKVLGNNLNLDAKVTTYMKATLQNNLINALDFQAGRSARNKNSLDDNYSSGHDYAINQENSLGAQNQTNSHSELQKRALQNRKNIDPDMMLLVSQIQKKHVAGDNTALMLNNDSLNQEQQKDNKKTNAEAVSNQKMTTVQENNQNCLDFLMRRTTRFGFAHKDFPPKPQISEQVVQQQPLCSSPQPLQNQSDDGIVDGFIVIDDSQSQDDEEMLQRDMARKKEIEAFQQQQEDIQTSKEHAVSQQNAQGNRTVESNSGEEAQIQINLQTECSDQEQEYQAIPKQNLAQNYDEEQDITATNFSNQSQQPSPIQINSLQEEPIQLTPHFVRTGAAATPSANAQQLKPFNKKSNNNNNNKQKQLRYAPASNSGDDSYQQMSSVRQQSTVSPSKSSISAVKNNQRNNNNNNNNANKNNKKSHKKLKRKSDYPAQDDSYPQKKVVLEEQETILSSDSLPVDQTADVKPSLWQEAEKQIATKVSHKKKVPPVQATATAAIGAMEQRRQQIRANRVHTRIERLIDRDVFARFRDAVNDLILKNVSSSASFREDFLLYVITNFFNSNLHQAFEQIKQRPQMFLMASVGFYMYRGDADAFPRKAAPAAEHNW